MLERSRRVVLLIDYDNLQICASRDTPGRDLQLTPVVQLAQRYGTVVLARAYAEWNLSTERLAVYKAGIEPAFAPVLRTESDRSGKSLADTVMVAEGMDMLWTLQPDVVVLATSDKDLIPLVRVAKQRGAFVVVLGSDFTAIPLREMADEHVTYKQLITDASGRYTTEGTPARQPAALPEPSRRRTRERNGREARAETRETRTEAREPREPRTEAREARAETREPHVDREAREPREPREPRAPATEHETTPEPVAPVSVGTPGETDGQIMSRRRRRRGSRRRSERVGFPGESTLASEGTPTGDAADVSESPGPEAEALDVADAATSTLQAPVSSFDQGIPPAPTEPVEPAAEPPAGERAAPRRRRRTTRTPTPSLAAAAEPQDGDTASLTAPLSQTDVATDRPDAVDQPAIEVTPTSPAPEASAADGGDTAPVGLASEGDVAAETEPAPVVRRRRRRTTTTSSSA